MACASGAARQASMVRSDEGAQEGRRAGNAKPSPAATGQPMSVVIPLDPSDFPCRGSRVLAHAGPMRAEAFRYEGGTEALRLVTPRADVVILPYLGQQIWRAAFDGRELAMSSMFDAPVATDRYLATYGAFFLHCGITRIGPPSPEDPHPLHGELPLGRFEAAHLVIDPIAGRIGLRGRFRHRIAFSVNYEAEAEVMLDAQDTFLDVTLDVTNRRAGAPLELMYLGHANFRPVDHGRLVYAARYTPQDVAVRRSIPPHVRPGPGLERFLDDLARDPAGHHLLDPALPFDPEVVFTIRMIPDETGWTHAMQVHPGGHADFISHETSSLPLAIRWVCRTGDQQGLGIALPSTAGVEGHAVEAAAGRIVIVPPEGLWRARMRMGALDPTAAAALEARIDRLAGRG
jgi:hypothetical protein